MTLTMCKAFVLFGYAGTTWSITWLFSRDYPINAGLLWIPLTKHGSCGDWSKQ